MKWLKPRVVLALTVSGAVIAASGQWLRTVIPDFQGWFLALSLLGVVLAAWTTWADKIAKEKSSASYEERIETLNSRFESEVIEQRAATRVLLEDSLDPLIEGLAAVASAEPPDRMAAANKVLSTGLAAVSKVVGGSARTRVNYYRIKFSARRRPGLALAQSSGRSGRSRTYFYFEDDDGLQIQQMFVEDSVLFVEDLRTSSVPGVDNSPSRSYETFISVPARVEEFVDGMLSVDAPKAGDLSETDIAFVRVVATAIATAFHMAKGPRTENRPEPDPDHE